MASPATLRPADATAAAAALAAASRDRRSVRVRGAGTKSYLGQLVPTDLVLETSAMAGVVDHVPADLTVTVGAGSRFADVQAALCGHGQWIPLDPPHSDAATIGGIVATMSDGLGRLRYGGIRDLLIGSIVALADGSVVRAGGRVVKNVAGYDLNKLFIGSLGTLGVMAEATLKVLPLPRGRAAVVVGCARAADAFALADALVRTPVRPSALVVDLLPGRMRAIVAQRGEPAQVERAMAQAAREAAALGARVERHDDDEPLLSPLRDLPATAVEGALVRAALPLAAQRSFAETAMGLEAFARCVADAGSGTLRVHLLGEDTVRASDTLLGAAYALGGSARVERRSGALTAEIPPWGSARPAGDFLMWRIKEAFDPALILEPGRAIVG